MRSGRNSWYDGMSTQVGASGSVPIALPRGATDLGGQYIHALFGKTWSDLQETTVGGVSQNFLDTVDTEWNLERIVGHLSFQFTTPFDRDPGQTGADVLWICRVGYIVVETDGSLGIPQVQMVGATSRDNEEHWLRTDQFVVMGVDRNDASLAFFDAVLRSPSADGLNHYVVNRHYDIQVKRKLEKNDLLVLCVQYAPFFDSTFAVIPNTIAGAMHGWIRVLGRKGRS